MDSDSFALPEAMQVLRATPATLRALLLGLDDVWLDFRDDPDAWSPREVLIHFIHNEQTNWIPRARVILSDGPVHRFAPFQQMPDGPPRDKHIDQLLAKFAELRRENLGILEGFHLRPEDYMREAEHPVLGSVNLGQLLAAWVVHDLNHLDQIEKTVAKRYRDAVGPWRRNLAILDR